MQPLISELVMAFALSLPIDGDIKCQWWGVRQFQCWNRDGWGVRLSVWGSGETHFGFGRGGVLVFQFRVF
jgi:hypothetical protein